jgi:hypothetical protein
MHTATGCDICVECFARNLYNQASWPWSIARTNNSPQARPIQRKHKTQGSAMDTLAPHNGFFDMLASATPTVIFVLLVLATMSLGSWTIILSRP